MPKRGRGGRGRGGRGGRQPRERRPALLGAPKPRPLPAPQPLAREVIDEAPAAAPKRLLKVRAPLSAYDKLVAGIQRSALSAKRSAPNDDLPPKKIPAKGADPADGEANEQDVDLPSDAVSDTEPAYANGGSDDEINEQQLADAVCLLLCLVILRCFPSSLCAPFVCN